MTPSDPPPELLIRKYPNRRFYDTEQSTHLTLEQIRDKIRQGRNIRVEDSRSGEEITGRVLTQIILEFDTPKLDILPNSLLARVIRSSDSTIQQLTERYLQSTWGALAESQRSFEHLLRLNPWLPATTRGLTPAEDGPADEGSATEKEPAPSAANRPPTDTADAIARLTERVQALSEELDEIRRQP